MGKLDSDKKRIVKGARASYNLWLIVFFLSVFIWVSYECEAPYLDDEFWEDSEVVIVEDQIDLDVRMLDSVANGVHVLSGLVAEGDYKLVVGNCGSCHSYELVTQNRNTREGWRETIIWMQETQNLPDLGKNTDPILDYLAKYYGPIETGRRPPLDQEAIEWYDL